MKKRRKEIAEFYKQILSDHKLKEKIVEKAKKIAAEEDLRKLIREEIMPLMKKFKANFSEEELLEYEKETLKEVSDEDLANVSGGLSASSLIMGGVLALTMAGGAMALSQNTYAEGPPGNTSSITTQNEKSDNDDILERDWDFNFLLNFIRKNGVDSVLEGFEYDKGQTERFLQRLNNFISANNTDENKASELKEIIEYRNNFEDQMKAFSFNGTDDEESVDWDLDDDDNNNEVQDNINNNQEIMNNIKLSAGYFWSTDENGILYVCEHDYLFGQHEKSGRGVYIAPIFTNSGTKEWVAPTTVTSQNGQTHNVLGIVQTKGSFYGCSQQLESKINGTTKNIENIETIKLQNGTKWFDFCGLNHSGLKIKTIDCSAINDSNSTIIFSPAVFDNNETLEKIIMPTKSKETVFLRKQLRNSNASCLESSNIKEIVVPLNAARDNNFLSLDEATRRTNIKLTVEARSIRDNIKLEEGEFWGEDSKFNQYICKVNDNHNKKVSISPVSNSKKFVVPSQVFTENNSKNLSYADDSYDRYYVDELSLAERDSVSTDGIEEIIFGPRGYHNFKLSNFQNSKVKKIDFSQIEGEYNSIIFTRNSFENNLNIENIIFSPLVEVCFDNNCLAGTKITSLNLDGSITIREGAFKDSALNNVNIASNETKLWVREGAFEGTNVKKLVVPENSTSVHLNENIGVKVNYEGQPLRNFITGLRNSAKNLAKSAVNLGKGIVNTFWRW